MPSPGVMSRKAGLTGYEQSNAGDTYYTPLSIIEAARASMGGIDLDPASSAAAQKVVQASRWYGKDADGLNQEWGGRVWLNPPYNGGYLRHFVRTLMAEFLSGSVTTACCLAPSVGGSTWPDQLSGLSSGIVALRQHLPWWGPGVISGNAHNHYVWLLGDVDPEPWTECPLAAAVYRTHWGMYDRISGHGSIP